MADDLLLIRADASTQMGTGHVMRCLALAQAWQDAGGRVELLAAGLAPGLEQRLKAEGVGVRHMEVEPGSAKDAQCTAGTSRDLGARWLVVDGYQFDASYQQAVKEAGLRLLFVDDNGHAAHYYADMVLNQNIHATEGLYARREPYTRLLLGTRYALLRREFWPCRGWRRHVSPVAHRVLVTLGGSDPDNITLKVAHALGLVSQDNLESVFIVGSSNPYRERLEALVRELGLNARIEQNVTDMPEPMSWADVCLSGAGSTCWELALMGLPGLLFILADNQRANAERLHAAGAAHNLGWHEDVPAVVVARETERVLHSGEIRTTMARTGQRLVDGYGTQRVVAGMLGRKVVRVRRTRQEDIALLFEWANDALTRAMSFHPDPIPWTDHEQWFLRVMAQPELLLLIVETEEGEEWTPCGQVRIDEDGTISISIAPDHRNQRLSVPALRAAMAYHQQHSAKDLIAYIKPENRRSQKLFTQAGFEGVGRAEAFGQPCLKYAYHYARRTADSSW